ncbi:hypothetical protein EBR57_05945 [bacterium]|nr:hypothetical protein [bacterium]
MHWLAGQIENPATNQTDRHTALVEVGKTYFSLRATHLLTHINSSEADRLRSNLRYLIERLSNRDTIEVLIDTIKTIPPRPTGYDEIYYPSYSLQLGAKDAAAEILNKISGLNSDNLNYLKTHPKMPEIIEHIRFLHRMDDWC